MARTPIYGNGTYELLPRGSGGRTPWVYDIDVNIGYRYMFDKDKSIGITMDIFNLFNFQQYTQVDENYTFAYVQPSTSGNLKNTVVSDTNGPRPLLLSDKNPNFGAPTAYQSPRQFRFGIRGTF